LLPMTRLASHPAIAPTTIQPIIVQSMSNALLSTSGASPVLYSVIHNKTIQAQGGGYIDHVGGFLIGKVADYRQGFAK
jgi:hypothetical protein